MQDFKGKVAVITGGARGVGRALGALLASRGTRVVLTDINPEKLEATVKELRLDGGDINGIAADVTSDESMNALADKVFGQYGTVNLLFNNAGVSLGDSRSPMWELPMKDWRWGFNVHVMGTMHGVRAFLPRMIARREEGFVVNTTSSTGGLTTTPTTPIYSSSKAVLASITEALYHQLRTHAPQIKVGLLYPGPNLVNTELMNPDRPEAYFDPSNPPPAGRTMGSLAQQMGRTTMTEPSEVAAFAVSCIESEQFWMLPEKTNTEGFEARAKSLLGRSNPA